MSARLCDGPTIFYCSVLIVCRFLALPVYAVRTVLQSLERKLNIFELLTWRGCPDWCLSLHLLFLQACWILFKELSRGMFSQGSWCLKIVRGLRASQLSTVLCRARICLWAQKFALLCHQGKIVSSWYRQTTNSCRLTLKNCCIWSSDRARQMSLLMKVLADCRPSPHLLHRRIHLALDEARRFYFIRTKQKRLEWFLSSTHSSI